MHEIFISYSSADQGVATRVVKGLEQHGLSCWISSREIRPGADYQASIASAIEASTAVVVLFSRNALASAEVPKEMSLAGASRKPLIPLRLENIEPAGAFRYQLANAQYVDIFADFEGKLQELCLHLDDTCKLSGEVVHKVHAAARRRVVRSWAGRAGLLVCATLAAMLAWKAAPALHAVLDGQATAKPVQLAGVIPPYVTPAPPAPTTPSPAETPPPPAPATNSLEDRARAFVTRYYAMNGAPFGDALAFLSGAVADSIRYYGQPISREKLIDTQRHYFAHWPQRQFTVRAPSLAASCSYGGGNCQVTGIIDYNVKSRARNAGALGAEQFSIQLTGVESTPVLTSLNATPILRKAFSLRPAANEFPNESPQPQIDRN